MTRPQVMGVLNVTPDSFSDGGRWLDPTAAIAHGRDLFAAGADVVDVGGESSRPGAAPVDPPEEERRVVPVIEALAGHGRVSVDTRHEPVARAAVAAGATIINDISSSLWEVAAATGAGYVAMHMQGEPRTMQERPRYHDVVVEVRDFLLDRAARAHQAGVTELWIDPGFGFGKTSEHNLTLLRHLGVLVDTGLPVLVGTSRKATVRRIAGDVSLDAVRDGSDVALEGSLATAVVAMAAGAAMVRAHDVAETVRAARIVGEEVDER